MTSIPVHDTNSETRAEFLAKIAKAYEVPMTLIRYQIIDQLVNDNK